MYHSSGGIRGTLELQVVFQKPPIQSAIIAYKLLDLKFRPKIRNLGHGRFRPGVLRHRYFYMMGVIHVICVHKLNSQTFYTAE
jgi:hypothetical protein